MVSNKLLWRSLSQLYETQALLSASTKGSERRGDQEQYNNNNQWHTWYNPVSILL